MTFLKQDFKYKGGKNESRIFQKHNASAQGKKNQPKTGRRRSGYLSGSAISL